MNNEQLSFEIIEGKSFLDNQSLKSRIVELVSHSYVNTSLLIERIYSVNDIAFLALLDEKIVGVLLFCFQDRSTIWLADQKFTAIYNGYAVTDLQYRNQRIIQKLVSLATSEFTRRIQAEDSRLLLYAITSNPYALRAYRKVCEHMEPFADGSFTEQGCILVTQLKTQLGITLQEGAHPFKFTTSLPQRYSDFEQVNLENAPSSERKFLESLDVIEVRGDRVIFFWGLESFKG